MVYGGNKEAFSIGGQDDRAALVNSGEFDGLAAPGAAFAAIVARLLRDREHRAAEYRRAFARPLLRLAGGPLGVRLAALSDLDR